MTKGCYYEGAMFEPVDKPINKTLAVKMYAHVLATERPNLSPAMRLDWIRNFGESIDLYRCTLDNFRDAVYISDLKENVRNLREELGELDEDVEGLSADEIDYELFERRNLLKPKFIEKQAELKKLQATDRKLKNKDLRFFLAAELMALVHQKAAPEALDIAQQTQDYWDAIRKKK